MIGTEKCPKFTRMFRHHKYTQMATHDFCFYQFHLRPFFGNSYQYAPTTASLLDHDSMYPNSLYYVAQSGARTQTRSETDILQSFIMSFLQMRYNLFILSNSNYQTKSICEQTGSVFIAHLILIIIIKVSIDR